MKIVLVNSTNGGGGAAIAARRLLAALQAQGADAHMLVQKQKAPLMKGEQVVVNNFYEKLRYGYRHWRNKKELKDYQPTSIFHIDRYGYPLERHPLIKSADVVHFHWVSDSFVNAESIQKLHRLGKKLFWTLHDMHPFTGGCHYAGSCEGFKTACGRCPQLQSEDPNDPSAIQLAYMKQHLAGLPLNIITPSRWLARVAAESALFSRMNISAIPNTIDFTVFSGRTKEERLKLRRLAGIPEKAFVLLFGAVAADQVRRKGFHLLTEALQIIFNAYGNAADVHLAIFGSDNKAIAASLPYPATLLGNLKDEKSVVDAFRMANVFVTPSLEDNLPNTIMESLACCTPVIGFPVGGIPEMIEHGSTGWVAKNTIGGELAEAIINTRQLIDEGRPLGNNARAFAQLHYSQKLVAQRHLTAYREALS